MAIYGTLSLHPWDAQAEVAMNPAWFADTSWFLAMIGPSDVHQAQAVSLSRGRAVPLITTAWVITELAAAPVAFCRRLGLAAA